MSACSRTILELF